MPDNRLEVNGEMFRWWIRKRYKLKKEPEDLREVLLTWPDEEIQKYISKHFTIHLEPIIGQIWKNLKRGANIK